MLLSVATVLAGCEKSGPPPLDQQIRVACAPGLEPVVRSIAAEYQKAYPVEVAIEVAPDGALREKLTAGADLVVAADDRLLKGWQTAEGGAIREIVPLGTHALVIALPKSKPQLIEKPDDLARRETRVAIPSRNDAAGLVARELLGEKLADRLATTVSPSPETALAAGELAGDAKADAALVWTSTVAANSELKQVRVGPWDAAPRTAAIGASSSTAKVATALHFARYVASREHGAAALAKAGLGAVELDSWADRPQLTVYCASELQPVLEECAKTFTEREHCSIQWRFADGRELAGAVAAGGPALPDLFISGDVPGMQAAAAHYPAPQVVSQNELALVIRKGNPRHITGFDSLARSAMRVGVGDPEKTIFGQATKAALGVTGGGAAAVKGSTRTVSESGAELMEKLVDNRLDAVIVFTSHAAPFTDRIEIQPVRGSASRVEPMAGVHQDSPRAQLARRLVAMLLAPGARSLFDRHGLGWQGE